MPTGRILSLSFAAFFLLMPIGSAAPALSFITPANADLTPLQNATLAAIRRLPTTRDARLVRLNPQALGLNAQFPLPLADNRFAAVQGVERIARNAQGFEWTGKTLDDKSGAATIVVNGQNVTGSIQTAAGLVRIRPIGGGLHAIVQVNEAAFPRDEPPTGTGPNLRDVQPRQPAQGADDNADVEIKVLVLYTTAVGQIVVDPKGLVDLAIKESNQSYVNSGIHLHLAAATAQPVMVSYKESNFDQELADLEGKTDGHMDEIHKIRDDNKADIVVLLVNDSAYCGLAGDILAKPETAFAVVYYDCATGYYSFAHEIGHLQGARHDIGTDNTATPFSYGHGYINVQRNQRTIMAYECPNQHCDRVQQWSRPGDWGNVICCNNAEVLNATRRTIASFR